MKHDSGHTGRETRERRKTTHKKGNTDGEEKKTTKTIPLKKVLTDTDRQTRHTYIQTDRWRKPGKRRERKGEGFGDFQNQSEQLKISESWKLRLLCGSQIPAHP